jgi:hypothetical protein
VDVADPSGTRPRGRNVEMRMRPVDEDDAVEKVDLEMAGKYP